MKNIIRKSIWAISLICILISCSQYPMDELLSAPEKIEIDGREYILETGLYRDFFPPMPPSGLGGSIYIIALDSLQFPSSLDASHLWVIKDDDVWDTYLIERVIPGDQIYKMKKRIRDEGPDWGPHIYVDVVVEIVNDENGSYLLRADSQWIGWLD